jgi:hypothetical protein
MKQGKFISILLFSLVLIALTIVLLWRFILPLNIKESIGFIRWRRTMELPLPPPPIMEMIETSNNRSNQRTSENILLSALGQLQISGPEDIMEFTAMESSCALIRPHLKVYEKHHEDLPDAKLYVRLFKAVEQFYAAFCGRNQRLRQLFTEHEDEMKALHEQFVDCDGAPDWYENKNDTTRCAEANSIVKCYGETLRNEIDESIARAFVGLLESVLNVSMAKPCSFTTSAIDLSFRSSDASKSSGFTAKILFFTLVVAFMS